MRPPQALRHHLGEGEPPAAAHPVSSTGSTTGYLHPGYAQSLAEFGQPISLARSGGALLVRRISGTDRFDAVAPYPLLVCRDWSALAADLDELGPDIVSVAACPDPFGGAAPEHLRRAFPDVLTQFKVHFVADLTQPIERIISTRHQKQANKSRRRVTVEICEEPQRYLAEWCALFDGAINRFDIRGMRAFSPHAFGHQLALPGAVMSLARIEGEIVSAHVQMVHGDVVYAHLAADTPRGRQACASYALYAAEIEYFASRARWIDWGGVAGIADASDGLAAFKRGWSTDTRQAWFGGRIVDRSAYDALVAERGRSDSYFPAYRATDRD